MTYVRGNTDLIELLENARRARRGATSAAQDLEAAAGSTAADGAAALDKAAAGANLGDGANRAEEEDPKKNCWMCHMPEHAVQLRVCSGCHKVRLFTAKLILIKANVQRLPDSASPSPLECLQARYCSEKCSEEDWTNHQDFCRRRHKKRKEKAKEKRRKEKSRKKRNEKDDNEEEVGGGEPGAFDSCNEQEQEEQEEGEEEEEQAVQVQMRELNLD